MTDRILPPAEVAEIRERAEKATPSLWHYCGQTRDVVCPCGHIGTGSDDHDYILAKVRWIGNADTKDPEDCELSTTSEEIFRANLSFIAHSRIDVPALCDTIEALRGENERLRAEEISIRSICNTMDEFGVPYGPDAQYSPLAERVHGIIGEQYEKIAALQRYIDEARGVVGAFLGWRK